MTIGEAVKKGTDILKECTDVSWLDAAVILGHVLKKKKWYLLAHQEEVLPEPVIDEYFSCLDKRLSGMPVQYITGHQEFMSLNFFVNQQVLIPRSDTETLVEEVLRIISTFPKEKTIHIADLCTGSGCIAVSTARNASNTLIKAADISRDALNVAEMNAELLGVKDRIEFICSDLFENVSGHSFDIIMSNPPYIASDVIESLQIEVKKYEPRIALNGGVDGLDFYRRIISEGYKYLVPGGLLILEIGFEQANAVKEISSSNKNYCSFKVIKDLAGNDRVVTIVRKN